MYLENNKISERQSFRIGVMENIAVGIMTVPYITSSMSGKYHFISLLVGLIMLFLYSLIIYFYSRIFSEGYINAIEENLGRGRVVLELIYILRYLLRGAIILLYFGSIIQEFLLRSYSRWGLIIVFLLVCSYGALRNIEKRGRLLELLFWWLVVPLILVAVFSITNIDWDALPKTLMGDVESVKSLDFLLIGKTGYTVFLVLSTVELLMYSLASQKKNTWENALKILVWIIISVLLAYIFIIGILGYRWAGSESTSVFNVMEASAFPGKAVERMDYPVLAFWIIGIFAIVSGYLFYAKEHARSMFGINKEENVLGEKNRYLRLVKFLIMPVLIVITLGFVWCWTNRDIGRYFAKYMLWIDVGLSILLPLIVLIARKIHYKKIVITGLMFCLCVLSGCKDKLNNRQLSLENRDYVVTMELDASKENFIFQVADLSDYKGASKTQLKTNEFKFQGKSIKEAIEKYYEKNERQLDLSHVESMTIKYENAEDAKLLIMEMEDFSSISKSVEVELNKGDEQSKKILRELIKSVYAGEELM